MTKSGQQSKYTLFNKYKFEKWKKLSTVPVSTIINIYNLKPDHKPNTNLMLEHSEFLRKNGMLPVSQLKVHFNVVFKFFYYLLDSRIVIGKKPFPSNL